MAKLRSLPRALRALFLPVFVGVGAAVGGLFALRAFHVHPAGNPQEANDVVGNYLQTLGTIYAVLLAFVVFVVWSQFNEARLRVDAEANELLDLARTARGLAGHVCDCLHDQLRKYMRIVIGPEWEAMARSDTKGYDAGWGALEEVWDHLATIEPKDDREQVVFSELLARFNDLSDARNVRLTSASLRIPLGLWLLLYFGAVTVVGSMYLFVMDSRILHALLTAGLAGSISHVLYIISDLDDCFAGQWQVPRSPFERVERYLARPSAPVAEPAPAIRAAR